jgi:hypothetical protein
MMGNSQCKALRGCRIQEEPLLFCAAVTNGVIADFAQAKLAPHPAKQSGPKLSTKCLLPTPKQTLVNQVLTGSERPEAAGRTPSAPNYCFDA